ncbi:MAG TPA: DUF4256 domain-containing protein [Gemmatales bacterium]|nr:DUF4256 domain-containing protein [Gemmatales bacterium]HMP18055.1 DUF4256 domain-containing protein [Gemmatales bacterium]
MARTQAHQKKLSSPEVIQTLDRLQARFEENRHRHPKLEWKSIRKKLETQPAKLWSLQQMECTGGEPDVVVLGSDSGNYLFIDCSAETPKKRISLCYDREGLLSRKEHRPKDSALDMAHAMGVELLSEQQYRDLQQLGDFDTKTSSWILTPADIREKGGALFGDKRYGHVFIYHNGAQSYYAVRGFRSCLHV